MRVDGTQNNMSLAKKAERATVQFFDGLSIDGYMMPDGSFRVSMSGASVLLGFAPNWLSLTMSRGGATKTKALRGLGFSGQIKEVRTDSSKPAKTISLDDFNVLVDFAIQEGKTEAMKLKGITINSHKQNNRPSVEKSYQLAIQEKEGGQIEVQCPAGRIDNLTSTEIIEVKAASCWKAAIGQVLVYGHYYPSHSKRIHLFGSVHTETKQMIQKNCDKLGVRVTWANK